MRRATVSIKAGRGRVLVERHRWPRATSVSGGRGCRPPRPAWPRLSGSSAPCSPARRPRPRPVPEPATRRPETCGPAAAPRPLAPRHRRRRGSGRAVSAGEKDPLPPDAVSQGPEVLPRRPRLHDLAGPGPGLPDTSCTKRAVPSTPMGMRVLTTFAPRLSATAAAVRLGPSRPRPYLPERRKVGNIIRRHDPRDLHPASKAPPQVCAAPGERLPPSSTTGRPSPGSGPRPPAGRRRGRRV